MTESWSRQVMDQEHGLESLEWLLTYELDAAVRYRRDVSLIMIPDGGEGLILRLLRGLLRRSDELFLMGGDAAILMGETEKMGAVRAIERCLSTCPGELELRFAVASYPKDGKAIGALLGTAHRRLELARRRERGTVVYLG